jgi:hypothetical protein
MIGVCERFYVILSNNFFSSAEFTYSRLFYLGSHGFIMTDYFTSCKARSIR